MKAKLTAKSVLTLPLIAGQVETVYTDTTRKGFRLRVKAGGARILTQTYWDGARERKVTLGSVPSIPFEKLDKAAEKVRAEAALGKSPADAKAERKAQAENTFESVANKHLATEKAALRESTYRDKKRYLLVGAKPLHRLPLDAIRRADIAACLTAVEQNAGRVTRRSVRSALSRLFNWAIGEGLTENNPVLNTNKTVVEPRRRVLSLDEIRLIWSCLPANQYGTILKLLLLTGQRRDEIADLRWTEIVGDSILLPGERTKNNEAHVIPLSGPALELILAQPRNGRELIFGYGQGGFGGFSKAKRELDAVITERNGGVPIPDWRVHDLRRSFSTLANDEGIAEPHIVEAILNHVSGHKGGVAGTYNLARYEPRKRVALERWASFILDVVAGKDVNSNVVTLARV